ncbi:hypothetical protein GCM10012275_54810 [Longimycelium tulufanense]|uniref:Uncharacterized protein n=1 Tax=Longimycelium tulufanense TaxID=907463 RepID=A0A8J3CJQ5_9PSEU|nr:hypothetical protein [Longimycelium tulufanense]GGM77220.1 hypothetical protein GCM10012275_54810 [Longimycelium tulufanense]
MDTASTSAPQAPRDHEPPAAPSESKDSEQQKAKDEKSEKGRAEKALLAAQEAEVHRASRARAIAVGVPGAGVAATMTAANYGPGPLLAAAGVGVVGAGVAYVARRRRAAVDGEDKGRKAKGSVEGVSRRVAGQTTSRTGETSTSGAPTGGRGRRGMLGRLRNRGAGASGGGVGAGLAGSTTGRRGFARRSGGRTPNGSSPASFGTGTGKKTVLGRKGKQGAGSHAAGAKGATGTTSRMGQIPGGRGALRGPGKANFLGAASRRGRNAGVTSKAGHGKATGAGQMRGGTGHGASRAGRSWGGGRAGSTGRAARPSRTPGSSRGWGGHPAGPASAGRHRATGFGGTRRRPSHLGSGVHRSSGAMPGRRHTAGHERSSVDHCGRSRGRKIALAVAGTAQLGLAATWLAPAVASAASTAAAGVGPVLMTAGVGLGTYGAVRAARTTRGRIFLRQARIRGRYGARYIAGWAYAHAPFWRWWEQRRQQNRAHAETPAEAVGVLQAEPVVEPIIEDPPAAPPSPEDIVDAEIVDEEHQQPTREPARAPLLTLAAPLELPAPLARQPELSPREITMSTPLHDIMQSIAAAPGMVPGSGPDAELYVDAIPQAIEALAAKVRADLLSIAAHLPQHADSIQALHSIADAIGGVGTQAAEQVQTWKDSATWVWRS